jgi:hypothetical protein
MSLTAAANEATLTEAAEIVGVNRATLRTAAMVGHVPASIRGGRYVVDLADVEAWNETRRVGRPPCYEDWEVEEVMQERGLSWDSARKYVWRRKRGRQ